MRNRCQQTVGEILLEMADRLEAEYRLLKKLSEVLLHYKDLLPREANEILDHLQNFRNTQGQLVPEYEQLAAEYEDLKRLSEILIPHRDILPKEATEILDQLQELKNQLK